MRSPIGLAVLMLALPVHAFVDIQWIEIGDPGNDPDTLTNCYAADCGSVPYTYYISRYEVTNAQYAEFLNAKAAADSLGLYNPDIGSSSQSGITRSGSSGSFTYSVRPGFENKPVNFVSFYDALRYTNWLHNGQGEGDTETGAYTLLGGAAIPDNGLTVTRNPGALHIVPSENEWYKAAYWDPGTQSFLDFPANSNTQTVCAAPGATPNTANCNLAAVTEVGAYTGSASPNGTFDQGGNVWEWNEQIESGSNRGIRGGGWGSNGIYLAAWKPINTDPTIEADDLGFRVASLVPEPDASLLGVATLAGLAALSRRRAPDR